MEEYASITQPLDSKHEKEHNFQPNTYPFQPLIDSPLDTQSEMYKINDPGPGHTQMDLRWNCDCSDSPKDQQSNQLFFSRYFYLILAVLPFTKHYRDTHAGTVLSPENFEKMCTFAAGVVVLLVIGACLIASGLPDFLLTKFYSGDPIPKLRDVRQHGLVPPIKDEGNCSSCFVHAAVSALEIKYWELNREPIDLSEQHILDCCRRQGSNGCDGASYVQILNCMKNVGVATEAEIPYEGVGDKRCERPRRKYPYRIMDWKSIEQNEEAMKEAINIYGPILASLTADAEFFSYGGGVFTSPSAAPPNLGVLIVGYGVETGTPVWYLRNSLGTDWGEDGYMHMKRNSNLRGIADGVFAILSVRNPVG